MFQQKIWHVKYWHIIIHKWIHTLNIIFPYLKKNIHTRTAAKEAVLLPIKSSSDDDPGSRHGFGAEASLPLTQGVLVVSHNTTRLYWMVFDLYECHICSDAVTVLFWIFFFIYFLFSAESLSLVNYIYIISNLFQFFSKIFIYSA